MDIECSIRATSGGNLRRKLLIGAGLLVVLLAATGATFALSTWGEVNRVSIDRPASAGVEAAPEPEGQSEPETDPETGITIPPSSGGLDVFLLVGSDSRDALEDLEGFGEFVGERADVVMVMIRPRDGSTAAVLSLPRDLLVKDVCGGLDHRLNDALEGCGDSMNGATALTLSVESVLGITVDHFALVDLAGFQGVVDAIGGYQICLDREVRDQKANLELPAGCTLASGEQTLAWMRSRNTQELTDSGWRIVPGVNDLTRNERQRVFMVSMLSRLSDFGSPQDIAAVAQAVAPNVTVDDELTLVDAVGLAWTMRGLGTGSVNTLEVPVANFTTAWGADVLVATVDVSEIVASYLSPESATNASPTFSK